MRSACIRSVLYDLPRSPAAQLDVTATPRMAFSQTAASCSDKQGDPEHWLHRYLPGVKTWIDRQVHWGWTKSVQDRCRTHPALKDREEDILNAMQREVTAVTEKYQYLETDSRSHTNIQIAAQTLATHKVLLPYVRNENEVIQMLKEQNGAKSEEGIRWMARVGIYCRQTMLRQAPFAQVVCFLKNSCECAGRGLSLQARLLKNMMSDQGGGFEVDVQEDTNRAEATITKCLYHTIFEKEQKPHLLQVCCCSQDAPWFDGLESYKLKYSRSEWLGKGDSCCRVEIRTTAPS